MQGYGRLPALFLAAVCLLVPAASWAQNDAALLNVHFRPGFGGEIFSRTVAWDENLRSSALVAYFGTFSLDAEVYRGVHAGLLVGYGATDGSGLVFRGLPFSLDYEGGGTNGFLLGAAFDGLFMRSGWWELSLAAQFLYSLGATRVVPLEQLNETGQFDIKGTWMRVQAGPVFCYRGFELFSPFLSVAYDKLWGKFKVNETIQDLSGSEEKKITAKGTIAVSFGTIYEPSPSFAIKAMGTVIPFNKGSGQGLGFDLGGSLRAVFSF